MLKKTLEILSEKNRVKLIFYLILSLFFVAIETSLLIIVYPLIDVFLESQTLDKNKVFIFLNNYLLIKNLSGLVFFTTILIIIRLIYFLLFNWIKYSYLNQIQKDLALKIFNYFHNRSYLKITKSTSSAFIRDITSETTTFKKCCDTYINLILEILISISICVFLFLISPLVFFSLIIFLSFFATIYFLIILKILRHLGKKRVIINKNIIKIVSESYKFFELIKINKVIKFFKHDLKKEFNKLMNLNKYSQISNLMPKLFIETILFLGFMMLFIFQIKNTNFEINISIASIFLISFLRLFPSVSKILSSIQNLNLYKFSVENIYTQINHILNTDKNHTKNSKKFKFENIIEIDNLTFGFNDNYILKNFKTLIKNKSLNAIVGDSGSGKSSFIKIFMGLIRPKSLEIKVDGYNIDIFKNSEWQSKIGYAGQNSLILNQSLQRNITLSDEGNINIERLKKAFYNSGLNTFLDFDKNINDELNESGSNFSGGQLQRICLARALYFSEGVLVLDEICSALDIDSEENIIKTLKNLSESYTILYITHRNNFHEYFDNLIKIK